MNSIELINAIKQIAISQQTVYSVYDGDVYDNWNSAETKYGSVNISMQGIVNNGNYTTYTLLLYYGDRLQQDKRNVNSIYTDGVNTLQSIINLLNTHDFIDIDSTVNYTLFEQKFMDYLAGAYCQIRVTTDSMLGYCALDDYVYIDDKDRLIIKLIDEINKHKAEDERLSGLLLEILYKIVGEPEPPEPVDKELTKVLINILYKVTGEEINEIDVANVADDDEKLNILLREILHKVDDRESNT